MEQKSGAYDQFFQDFMDRDAFPAGYYVVNGTAQFSVDGEHYNIEAKIDFKVLK
ncbi:hypothetical protein [Oceanobacillus limi]|uniref:hypothetical protein n=1 Tax=Oceanobacillus limi TaxID=930131 RepID=UPI00147E2743|nr:hypothetical protein [Oceanobacillus limi]